MKKRVQMFALAGVMIYMSIVPMLEGKKLLMQPEMRNDNQLINVDSKEDKQQRAVSKKTHEKLKSAREQYKKQLARLIELLAQADQLGRGVEESEVTTRDLKDFFGSLGSVYTSVVDTITGAGELKKRIHELEQSNTQLLGIIQVLKAQLDQRDVLVKQLQTTLRDQKVQLDQRDALIKQLQMALNDQKVQLDQRDTLVKQLKAALQDQKAQLNQRDALVKQLQSTLQDQKAEFDQQDVLTNQLQTALQEQKNKNDVSMQQIAQLEKEKILWLDYLNDLESCAIVMREGKKESEDASQLVEQMLTSAYQAVLDMQGSKA